MHPNSLPTCSPGGEEGTFPGILFSVHLKAEQCGFVELWCFTGYRLKRKDKGSVSLQQDADVTHVLFLK